MVEAAQDMVRASIALAGIGVIGALVVVAVYYGLAPYIARLLRDRS